MKDIPAVLEGRNPYVVKRSIVTRDLIEEAKPKKFLDVGCRAGVLLTMLSEDIELHGIDLLEKSKAVPEHVHYKQADISQGIPYDDESFDVVNCSEIIEHLTDTAFFLKECFRILKKGGRLVLSTPNLHYWRNLVEWLKGNQYFFIDYHDQQEGHVRYFCPKSIKELSEQAGFESIRTLTVGDVGAGNPILKFTAACFEKLSRNKNCILIMSAERL